MPILHNCTQRSEAWEKLRLGIPTASCFSRIWTPPQKPTATGRTAKYPLGKESDQWEGYANKLLAERITGVEDEDPQYRSPWMDRGSELERDAIQWYELCNDVDTTPVGFITTNDGKIGCSPDRLVGEDGLVEFKSPRAGTHIGYWIRQSGEPFGREVALKALDHAYWVQLQGQLYISERKWVDIVSYHPRLVALKVCIRVLPDHDYIDAMATELRAFCHYLDEISARLCPDWRDEKSESLPAQLRAKLEIIP